MSRTNNEAPRPVCADPVSVHMGEVDSGAQDLATMVHTNAKVLCDRLGEPCGCQMNLPEGKCIANFEPCPYAHGEASGEPYAIDDDEGRNKTVAERQAEAGIRAATEGVERAAKVKAEAEAAAAKAVADKAAAAKLAEKKPAEKKAAGKR